MSGVNPVARPSYIGMPCGEGVAPIENGGLLDVGAAGALDPVPLLSCFDAVLTIFTAA